MKTAFTNFQSGSIDILLIVLVAASVIDGQWYSVLFGFVVSTFMATMGVSMLTVLMGKEGKHQSVYLSIAETIRERSNARTLVAWICDIVRTAIFVAGGWWVCAAIYALGAGLQEIVASIIYHSEKKAGRVRK